MVQRKEIFKGMMACPYCQMETYWSMDTKDCQHCEQEITVQNLLDVFCVGTEDRRTRDEMEKIINRIHDEDRHLSSHGPPLSHHR